MILRLSCLLLSIDLLYVFALCTLSMRRMIRDGETLRPQTTGVRPICPTPSEKWHR
jgi:hypothetical protein